MPYFKKNNDLTATHKITLFFNKYAKMERDYLCIRLFLTLPFWRFVYDLKVDYYNAETKFSMLG